jgi:predicted transcriptional regulator
MTASAYEYNVSTEEVLLNILRKEQVRTMDSLVEASGLDWSQVFLAIDRLSRSGDIRLQRAGGLQYEVRIKQAVV